jgi:hypothetical protein
MILARRRPYLAKVVLTLVACTSLISSLTSVGARLHQLQQPTLAEHPEIIQGEASGSFTAAGKTVTLKYAYAWLGRQFKTSSGDVQAYHVTLTDRPLPAESLITVKKFRTDVKDMLILGQIHGLEYIIHKYGYWVAFHWDNHDVYDLTSTTVLKEFSVENNIVKGRDEGKENISGATYSRAVSFVAPLPKGKP